MEDNTINREDDVAKDSDLNHYDAASESEDVKDFKESTSSAIGCPSAKYFVHPRVGFSVRGNS